MTNNTFDLKRLNRIRTYRKRIDYCEKLLTCLGSGGSRNAYLLPDGNVLKLGQYESVQNKIEVELYNKVNKKEKSHLAKIISYHPKFWYLIVERLEYVSEYDLKKYYGYNNVDQLLNGQLNNLSKKLQLNRTKAIRCFRNKYGIGDLIFGTSNWGMRLPSKKPVILDYAYIYNEIKSIQL